MPNASSSLKFVLEGTVIVISILLAFTIQAWWDESKEQEEVERILTSILNEHESNREAVLTENAHRVAVYNHIMKLFSLAAVPEPSADPILMDELLGALTWMQIPRVTWGAIDSVLEGGQLPLIENVELRSALVQLHRFQSVWEMLRVDEQAIFDTVLAPYLRKNTLLPQIAMSSTGITKPGEEEPAYDFDIPLGQFRDHSALLEDSEFLGLLMQKLWTQTEAIDINQRFLETSDSLIQLIEAELDL